jgi:hypothetical protein
MDGNAIIVASRIQMVHWCVKSAQKKKAYPQISSSNLHLRNSNSLLKIHIVVIKTKSRKAHSK